MNLWNIQLEILCLSPHRLGLCTGSLHSLGIEPRVVDDEAVVGWRDVLELKTTLRIGHRCSLGVGIVVQDQLNWNSGDFGHSCCS